MSSDWNTTANWTPATVPNGANDVASFGTSTITELTLSSEIIVAACVYDANAESFTISSAGLTSLTFAGDGIVNTSATSQSFVVDSDEAGSGGDISFSKTATISGPAKFTVKGQNRSGSRSLPTLEFHNHSSAGSASFVCEPAQVEFAGNGQIEFFDSASAGTGQFICEGSVASFTNGGGIFF